MSEIDDLRKEMKQMRADMSELMLGYAVQKAALDEAYSALSLNIAQDRQRIKTLEISLHKIPLMPKGAKTDDRLRQIASILKERNSCSYKELKRLLDVSPKEMNRLVALLDNRSYEVFVRNGDKRQKIIRIKAQINGVNNV